MSQLRLGRLPDGTRDIRICDDGAVGRASFTRYAVRGASIGDIVVTPKRKNADKPLSVAQGDLDDGGVEPTKHRGQS